MTRKQGTKTQTEAGGTRVDSSESSDSFPGMHGTLYWRSLEDTGTQSLSPSSCSTVTDHTSLPLIFSLKPKLFCLHG